METCFGFGWVSSSNFASHLWDYLNAAVPKIICVSGTVLFVSLGSDYTEVDSMLKRETWGYTMFDNQEFTPAWLQAIL